MVEGRCLTDLKICSLVINLIDPREISVADAPANAADFTKFGKVEVIILDPTAAKWLDLTDETVQNKVGDQDVRPDGHSYSMTP
jgi:hypothetical protein